ncbi:MAG TPA: HAMP domain-containing sensor histidine kinase [Acidimicrobiales bacterium]|nr:HAMP domain-containing sensor histidine kinase [Acidimicrobiales bacterium]
MRRRISLTMAAMVVGALVLVGLATLGLTQLDSIHQTQAQLVTETQNLASGVQDELGNGRRHDELDVLQKLVSVLKGPFEQQGEVLAASSTGTTLTFLNPLDPAQRAALPSGLTSSDLESSENFVQGLPVSGNIGRLVWAAILINTPIPVGPGKYINAVVVLTRRAPSGLGTAGTWFALASAATVVVALLAADRLGRRLARPLKRTEEVTSRIAAGDLAARVQISQREGHELVSLANSVNQMAASLARAQRTQRQFLMSVSHDLRTPLTSIRGFAEALADGTATNVEHASDIILSEARRLERLVADLLELAKLEAGTFNLNCMAVDLSEVVAEGAQAFEPAADGLGLRVELDTAPAGTAMCQADPDRLAQVVSNVVENALKYARSTVRVSTACPALDRQGATGQAVLYVEDDGPGIAPEDLDKVFQRLFQSASAASRKLGSGLGLAIVEELVSAMGGRAWAESPLGQHGGTRMVIALPAAGPLSVATPNGKANVAADRSAPATHS